jgi:hypothetical protein
MSKSKRVRLSVFHHEDPDNSCSQFPAEDIPETLMRQMSTCQTAANEFLRQFWLSVYPPPSQLSVPLTETVKIQRASKAAKVIGYLATTREKVTALVRTATQEKVDPKRVEMVSTLCLFVLWFSSVLALSTFRAEGKVA